MRRTPWVVVAAGFILVFAMAWGLRSGRLPLGVPNEWEWLRVRSGPSAMALGLAVGALVAYAAFVGRGLRSLGGTINGRREAVWLAGLVVVSIPVQGLVQEAAPAGYGLSKWILALSTPGSSGYYTIARTQMSDPSRFLSEYPGWIARQDALHVGTHPPGLFLLSRLVLGLMEANPSVAKAILDGSPDSVSQAAQALREAKDFPRADGATLALIGGLTLGACALTVIPLYLLARSNLPATSSWIAAAFWPVVPSALMFQPAADTAFPLLSTSALALAAWAARNEPKMGYGLAVVSGLILGLGMQFTLAFLPVGLVVAMLFLGSSGSSWGRRLGLVLATGIGFLGVTLAWWAMTSSNPFVVWWWNQRNHARFYEEYPRSYRAWVLVNPVELAVGLGLPTSLWVLVGLRWPGREIRVSGMTLVVLALLTLGGRNLSEVARLWLPMMPALLVSAGSGFGKIGAGPASLAASTFLVGLQTLILESSIQVVYPVSL